MPKSEPRGSETSFFVRGDRWAVAAGVFSLALAVSLRFVVGSVYGAYEARVLMSALAEGGFYLVATIGSGSATIMALMLTVLSLTTGGQHNFSRALYGQIRWITILCSISFVGSIVTMLLMCVPLTKADNFPDGWITGLYYAISTLIAVFSGLMVSIVVMLLIAVLGLIRTLAPSANPGEPSEADGDSES